jgi:energy-converting hydrogenase A subunit R
MNMVCFDLEGPLVLEDNAYELMKLIPGGKRVFEVISRYDDLLSLEEGTYEPGNTLSLIAPFLIHYGIKEETIVSMGESSHLTPGVQELISDLNLHGWQIFCISTSYEQYALTVIQRLGIRKKNVTATPFPLGHLRQSFCQEDSRLIERVVAQIADLKPVTDDDEIKKKLDLFYEEKLQRASSSKIISNIRPVGGRHKVAALKVFVQRTGVPLSRWAVIGDSITDARMLHAVNSEGGLAIAFNANEYALSHATVSLASTDSGDLLSLLSAWTEGGRSAAEDFVKTKAVAGAAGGVFHWLCGENDLAHISEIHNKMRRLLRKEAGQLG